MLNKLSLFWLAGTLALPAALPEGVINTQTALDQPLGPHEALKKIRVPEGFRVTLFAAEPDLLQPVAFDFDDRGRLWVVECFSYPDFKSENKDRVLIFTDKNNDGQFDERKVFLDNGRRRLVVLADPWFRGVSVHYGPDGGVFVTDWNDFGECHDYDGAYRSSGRMYKIIHGAPRALEPFNLASLPDAALVQHQLSENDWFVRHARRLLQERAAAGTLEADTPSRIRRILDGHTNVTRNLRALWALHAIGAADANTLARLLTHENEHMRWWAVKLAADSSRNAGQLQDFVRMAREDDSGLVRLGLASALQRLPLNDRWELAEALASRSIDAKDPNLPLMVWYGIEPAVPNDTERAIQLMKMSKIPLVRQFIARRVAAAKVPSAERSDAGPSAARSR